MNRKSFALLVGIVAAGAVTARAQTDTTAAAPAATSAAAPAAAAPAPAAPSLGWTVTPTYVSEYMFRGQRLGGQSLQPSVEADYGNWALGVWASDPLNNSNKVEGQSDPEIDPYGSYTYNLTGDLSLQPGFTLYTYTRAPLNEGFYRMTFEPNIALNYTIDGLKLTPKFYYDTVLRTNTEELNAAFAVPLKELGTELDFAGTYGGYVSRDAVNTRNSPAPDYRAWGDYWLVGVSLPFQINKATKLTTGYAYTRGNDSGIKEGTSPAVPNSSAVGRGVVTVSLAFSF
jgi:hypothetical protein